MPALDAFHVKQDIWENSVHTGFWHGFADHFMRSIAGEYANEPEGPVGNPGFTETGSEFDRRVRAGLELSETFYVAPLMNRMVTAASNDWPVDEAVVEEDFPTPYGFLYIPGGLSLLDIRGRMLVTEVVMWAVRGSEVQFIYWCHKRHDPLPQRKSGWEEMPDWLPWHVTEVTLGKALPRMLQIGTLLPPEVSEQVVWVRQGNGLMGYIPEGWAPEDLRPSEKPDHVIAWVISALRIMQQPLASVETQGMPANVRKALMKHRKRLKNTRVTVIDFRRREGDFEAHGEREYSHRFLRRGHWQRQPYKREDGSWDRRRIWIHPTIVGDPSLPLILRDHVNALTR